MDYERKTERVAVGYQWEYLRMKMIAALNQLQLFSLGDGLHTVGGIQFFQDTVDVGLGGTEADDQLAGDLAVGQA